MRDHLVKGVAPGGLSCLGVISTAAARTARDRHQLAPTSAGLLAEGLTAGLLLGALQPTDGRVNIQVECDGPARGLLVDADTHGNVRGLVRSRVVNFPLYNPDGRFSTRPALGGAGYISVLREQGPGKIFRGVVDLGDGALDQGVERYFRASEQTYSALALEVLAWEDEPLTAVAGILLQALPGGDLELLDRLQQKLRDGYLASAMRVAKGAQELITDVLGDVPFELRATEEVRFACRCSREGVVRAISTLGPAEVADMIIRDHRADVTCDFCSESYAVEEPELRAILDAIDRADLERGGDA